MSHPEATQPSLTTAPAEIRQQILSSLFEPEFSIKNGELKSSPWQLEAVCRLLKQDMEVLQDLHFPPTDVILRLTSPNELRQLPAVTTKVMDKATRLNKTWEGFKEVELALFHPKALQEASKDAAQFFRFLSRTGGIRYSDSARPTGSTRQLVAEVYNTVKAWQEDLYYLYTAFDPAIAPPGALVRLEVTLPSAVAFAPNTLPEAWIWWSWELDYLTDFVAGIDQDYGFLYDAHWLKFDASLFPFVKEKKGLLYKPYYALKAEKGELSDPRAEITGSLPIKYRAVLPDLDEHEIELDLSGVTFTEHDDA
ncbi:uncharacterized protein BDZ99DRAFT_470739 [Mytilinidion resinicola]|uniref:Uncharacterized protein n=1 Tax=Mytilinidion resinicola TaxID=574789 RepID=A0A6A6ZC28_9PEZI|nr:uncharacterized protein BDZ99DRAFT_470739 [Mytilinidion resinicola]KAF2817777.1 hypothetical protein BDZ99DRAFT_470739 [Mytilinidion resinicola]